MLNARGGRSLRLDDRDLEDGDLVVPKIGRRLWSREGEEEADTYDGGGVIARTTRRVLKVTVR